MSKKATDGQPIIVGRKISKFQPLKEADWQSIEEQSGLSLKPELRAKLSRAISLYAKSGPSTLETVTTKSLFDYFVVWKSRTDLFRGQLSRKVIKQKDIGSKPIAAKKKFTSKDVNSILERYFSQARYSKPNLATDDVAYMLEGASKLTQALMTILATHTVPRQHR